MKKLSIKVKIISAIVVILIITIFFVTTISVSNQKNDLLNAKKRTLALNTDILNNVIKSIMLSGEAPIAVSTMKNLKTISDFKEINIYRKDGTTAFNNYDTIEFVNNFQDIINFQKTGRTDRKIIENPSFQSVLNENLPDIKEIKAIKEMEYFFPIRNERECWTCHDTSANSGPIRGIAHFKVSIADIYKQINVSRIIFIILFAIAGITLAVFLIMLINLLIIKPLFIIGKSVTKFGEGNLNIKVELNNKDELGDLADKINNMFISIKERFHLSKYVSKSTEELIKRGKEIDYKTEKKQITVLFSDIRGFTSYSEKHDPSVVIENLNRVLQIQSRIVEKHGGDIDKYVGDEIMAVFNNELDAVKCGFEMIVEVMKDEKKHNNGLLIGIGINTGEVIAGNIGSENRLEYAVIGDTINLASRLCNLAKPSMLLISEPTYQTVKDKVKAKLIEGQKIKGKTGSINFYVVYSFE